MSSSMMFWSIVVAVIAVLATRMLPFLMLARHQNHPLLHYLGSQLPAAIIVILVIFSLQDMSLFTKIADHWYLNTGANGWPLLAAATTVALLHLWKRNALVSIISGTGIYMLLVQSGL